MLKFEPISIKHRPLAAQLLCAEQFGLTEGSFADLFLWGEYYNTQICIDEEILFIRANRGKGIYYLFPYGTGDRGRALERIRKDAEAYGTLPMLRGITARMRARLEEAAPGMFEFIETRDSFDYIYNAGELRDLPGKRFHQKRNHFNKFLSLYGDRYVYDPITQENLTEVREFQKRWFEENLQPDSVEALTAEMRGISRAFDNYEELKLIGGLIRIDGNVAAYSFGSRLCSDSFLVSVEKGDYSYSGIYQAINCLFARENCQNVKYINREDDAGVMGLRKAKLSYHPEILLEKFQAVWKGEAL